MHLFISEFNKIELLVRTLSFIENNLNSDLQTEEIAKACYASKYSRLFT